MGNSLQNGFNLNLGKHSSQLKLKIQNFIEIINSKWFAYNALITLKKLWIYPSNKH